MFRQRKLYQNAVDGGIGVQFADQLQKLILSCFFRQRVLNGIETALLGCLAFGIHVSVAGRIVADDDNRETGLHTLFRLKRFCRFADRLRYRSRLCLSVNHNCHASCSCWITLAPYGADFAGMQAKMQLRQAVLR
ncbi:hypothetical protein D3C87_1450020 [compost metagenome]